MTSSLASHASFAKGRGYQDYTLKVLLSVCLECTTPSVEAVTSSISVWLHTTTADNQYEQRIKFMTVFYHNSLFRVRNYLSLSEINNEKLSAMHNDIWPTRNQ